jgi:hypothetical protein
MMKSNEFPNGIYRLVTQTKLQNPKIGDYIEHYINENLIFRVKFSNGWLNIPREWAQDEEVKLYSISEEDIKQMANSFELTEIIDNEKGEDIIVEYSPVKTESFLRKVLIFLGLQ